MSTHIMNKDAIPSLSSLFRFQWEEVQNCHVVLYPEGMVKLSQSAGQIMLQVNSTSTINDIIQTLSDLFDGADVEDDVLAFFEQAIENDWIQLK